MYLLSYCTLPVSYTHLINEKYGHNEGDLAIIETIKMIKSYLNKREFIFRLEGDNFIVVFEDRSEKEVIKPVSYTHLFRELGKDGISDLLSLAKRDEEVYKYGENIPYVFSKDQEALKIFQRVRDCLLYTSRCV